MCPMEVSMAKEMILASGEVFFAKYHVKRTQFRLDLQRYRKAKIMMMARTAKTTVSRIPTS